jgi:Right handed beta helix region
MRWGLVARAMVVAVLLAIVGAGAGGVSASAGAVFTVTTGADSGAGSLRQAILDANGTAGRDAIQFSIGTGAQTIAVTSGALPSITEQVVIDGTTQPGFSGTPLVRLTNATGSSSTPGLDVEARSSVVRGLVITGFGDGITLGSGGANTVAGNFLGVLKNGNAAPNAIGVAIRGSDGNVVGGVTAADRNVISGNSSDGVRIDGSDNVVEGNYVGTDRAGAAAVPNGGSGVAITAGSGNLIGSFQDAARNVISGNAVGVTISGSGATENTIPHDFIGTDASGEAALGNTTAGVVVDDGANDTRLDTNLVSGNGEQGVEIGPSGPVSGTIVTAGRIGTDEGGTVALGNGGDGVLIEGGSTQTTVGELVISGNGGAGVHISGRGTSQNLVLAVRIGTNLQGSSAIPNATGIVVDGHADQNMIEQATVSGNAGDGVHVGSATNTLIRDNFIGTAYFSRDPLGNGGNGVRIDSNGRLTSVGTRRAGGNTIWWNGGAGVLVDGARKNRILRNSIFANGGLGISLVNGGNDDQPSPSITSVERGGSSTTIKGSLSDSAPSLKFVIEVFISPSCDESGSGEGQNLVLATTVTTDSSGNATWTATTSHSVAQGQQLTATATVLAGKETSAFSACFPS